MAVMSRTSMPCCNSLSIIIPTFNEVRHGYFKKILDELCGIEGVEIIIVDGGSSDGTEKLCKSLADRCFLIQNSSRGQRMNYGYKMSKGEILLFHHPRSFISKHAVYELKKNYAAAGQDFWGGFTHKFERNSTGLRFTSWYSNHIRRKIFGIIYLDHCIFATRNLIEKVGGFPEREIFEDTVFSRKMYKFSRPLLLKNDSITSCVRFEENGFLIQSIMNQVMKICFLCGMSDIRMNTIYEKGLNLNKR